ncbi:hypothetical protein IVA82_21420 [Bradyrhizobium sp. 142]|nr:hypothetical protein [Bradyrhizobium sp. 142]
MCDFPGTALPPAGEGWVGVLARSVVTKVDVNKIVARLRTDNKLLIPDWEKRRPVPQDGYRLQRA